MSDDIMVLDEPELLARTKKKPKSIQIETPELWRILPKYASPRYATAQAWRDFVIKQPVMVICRETLTQQLISLPWKLSAVNPEQSLELEDVIEYHTDILNRANEEDFDTWIERAIQDTLTLPFGGASEAGRYRDESLAWVKNIDGGTLFPTEDPEYPVGQKMPGVPDEITLFPKSLISRAYLAPRPEYNRKGWGMAPPEKIFLTALMLAQGDLYYWKMLVDTPEAGILDLGDMKKESAIEWVNSFRDLMAGVNPLKIPVAYEHEKPINFISFGRSPVDIQMRDAVLWYSALCAGGYGIPLSELGLKLDETLAGAIRSDRRARRTGFGMIVSKATNLVNGFLPKTIRFAYVDRDDEALALLGRARSVSFTAFRQGLEAGFLTPDEVRGQIRAEGLMETVVLTKAVPQGSEDGRAPRVDEKNDERTLPESQGGEGVVREETRVKVKSLVEESLKSLLPVYRSAIQEYTPGEVVDFGLIVRSDILSDERREDALVPPSAIPEGDDERFALAIAAEVLSEPWARRTLQRAWAVPLLRGTPLYNRLTGLVSGYFL